MRHRLAARVAGTTLALAVALACARYEPAAAPEADSTAAMADAHAGDAPTATPAATTAPIAEVAAEEVVYGELEGRPLRGYLARPAAAAAAPRPGLIVIHEWWGLNDNIRGMAQRLAGLGYEALAVDLYEGAAASDADAAQKLMQAAMEKKERLAENLRQAYRHLAEIRQASEVGVIGWCFGGGWALQTALLLPAEIDATVIYYGRVETDPAKLAAIQGPLVGFFGEKDQAIPVASVRQFEAALRQAGKDATIHVYPGADHAFANPSGGNYDAAAADDAWAKTVAFLERTLG
jgi:carboxymethylenebutenolidase